MNALLASRNGTILLADDCTRKWPAVLESFNSLVKSGQLRAEPTILPRKAYYNSGGRHNTGVGWCGAVVQAPGPGSGGGGSAAAAAGPRLGS